MQNPVFTVIISTYNRSELLKRAIRSVLSQSFDDFELLVIDNGSTDNTHLTVGEFQDKRIKYILNPRPTSSCDGPRNLGIDMARGSLISFLDDDDRWHPEKLKKSKEAFDAHPEAHATCHYENRINFGKLSGCIMHDLSPGESLLETLLYEKNCLSPCAITIRTEVLKELKGFDLRKDFSAAADYDMWLRMAKWGAKVHFIKEALGEFFFTGDNGCVIDPDFNARVAYIVEYHMLRYEGKKLFQLSKQGARRIIRMYLTAAISLLEGKRFIRAIKYFIKVALFLMLRPSSFLYILRTRNN